MSEIPPDVESAAGAAAPDPDAASPPDPDPDPDVALAPDPDPDAALEPDPEAGAAPLLLADDPPALGELAPLDADEPCRG